MCRQAANGVTALDAVRNAGGGWGFLARNDQSTDANSTGLVLEALRTVNGTADAEGIGALLALQVGCTGAVADRGGIAFQPVGGALTPDSFATVQALPALAEVALPITSATISAVVPTPCASSTTTTTVAVTSTTVASAGSTVPVTTTTTAATAIAALPRTGTSSEPIVLIAAGLLAIGTLFVGGTRRRHT